MSAIRTLISAVSLVAAAVLIAGWALAQAIVGLVEDGTAARTMTERAVNSPAVMSAVSDDLSERTAQALADRGLNLTALGVQGHLSQVISTAVNSDLFKTTLLGEVSNAHAQFTEQLSATARQPAPLTLSVDLSQSVNNRMSELGVPAAVLPELDLPPVSIEVMDAERFEQARAAYSTVLWFQSVGLWLGLAAIAVGFLMSHRRRWFFAKALFGVGLIALGVGGVFTLLGPETIATFLPGGEDGTWAVLWRDVVGVETADTVVERSLVVGGIAMVAALVATGVGASLADRRR